VRDWSFQSAEAIGSSAPRICDSPTTHYQRLWRLRFDSINSFVSFLLVAIPTCFSRGSLLRMPLEDQFEPT
jgi:hypothetical protein